MLTDFEGNVYVHFAAIDAARITGILPKFVLEQLLHKTIRVATPIGRRFYAIGEPGEIALSLGVGLSKVYRALDDLTRWGWIRELREGHRYELGYESAGGSDVFYGYEAYMNLYRRLEGVKPDEECKKVTQAWLKEIEEASNARGL